mmetsp:Transcript_16480/g.45329  ORF Transcript_16480/g.45329 Transcript_16480/m.45329 type:complete len:243 (-) Transcript_16480:744-1472(-)
MTGGGLVARTQSSDEIISARGHAKGALGTSVANGIQGEEIELCHKAVHVIQISPLAIVKFGAHTLSRPTHNETVVHLNHGGDINRWSICCIFFGFTPKQRFLERNLLSRVGIDQATVGGNVRFGIFAQKQDGILRSVFEHFGGINLVSVQTTVAAHVVRHHGGYIEFFIGPGNTGNGHGIIDAIGLFDASAEQVQFVGVGRIIIVNVRRVGCRESTGHGKIHNHSNLHLIAGAQLATVEDGP